MRILITGGAGYIGSHATRVSLARGHDVWVYDNLSRGDQRAVPADRLIIGDLSDQIHLESILRAHSIEAVIHLAGLTSVTESLAAPAEYYRSNVVGTLFLLEAVRVSGVKRFVYSSSAAVYGVPSVSPIDEAALCLPITPYGRTKLIVEQLLADYAAAYKVGYVCLRYFNVAGASPDGSIGENHVPESHLIPQLLQVALGVRSHVDVFGATFNTADGTCHRDYVHVDDVVEAHLLALESIEPGVGRVFNLGTGTATSVLDAISICERVTGRKIAVRFLAARGGEPAQLISASWLAQSVLQWKPRYQNLEDIVATAWRWHQSHPYGYV